jgi:FkbM family methyltransferase
MLRQVPHRIPGKTRVARALLRSAAPARLPDRFGHSLAMPSLQDPISYHLFANGMYEPAVVRLLQATLDEGSTFLDIGANVGAHTLLASDLVGSSGRVIAVEPSPRAHAFLSSNVELNRARNVTLERCALSDRAGSAGFYVPNDPHLGMAGLIPRFHQHPVQIETTTLDELIKGFDPPAVHLLKVDVEGAEALVFRGAADTLSVQHPPLIVFEFADWAETGWSGIEPGSAQRLLRDLGYDLWELNAYLAGARPLKEIMTSGTCMLVARRK